MEAEAIHWLSGAKATSASIAECAMDAPPPKHGSSPASLVDRIAIFREFYFCPRGPGKLRKALARDSGGAAACGTGNVLGNSRKRHSAGGKAVKAQRGRNRRHGARGALSTRDSIMQVLALQADVFETNGRH